MKKKLIKRCYLKKTITQITAKIIIRTIMKVIKLFAHFATTITQKMIM